MVQQTFKESAIETVEDQILTERAQSGDTEAFGELVRRHRHSASAWARSMARDVHLAEDIVQDSLIKAFLHVGQLVDSSRFIGWLQAIVRNQANMKLRRGGPFRNERPFTSFSQSDFPDTANVDWSDIDSILYYLSTHLALKQDEYNPEALYLRKETIEMIHSLLHCLNRKERGIFEAYFFKQWSPDEIAALFQTTTKSVYTYIYRAKHKVRKEHARMFLPSSNKKEPEGGLRVKKLTLPDSKAPVTTFTFIDCVYRMLHMLNDEHGVSELMGRSGCAFRLRISGLATYADGAFVFDWEKVLSQLFEEIGYETHFLCAQLPDEGMVPLVPVASAFPMAKANEQNSKEILSFVKRFIDAHTPIMCFDTYVQKPYTYEWSIIWGYNEEQQIVYVTDPVPPYIKTISFEDLSSSSLRFLCGIQRRTKNRQSKEQRSYVAQLQRIWKIGSEGDGYDPKTTFPFYSQGLNAYNTWIEHLNEGANRISAHGMSYLAHVYADCRQHAVQYLTKINEQLERTEVGNTVAKLMRDVISGYESVAKEWKHMNKRCPFMSGNRSLEIDSIKEVQERLKRARSAETKALKDLQSVIKHLKEGEGTDE